MKPSLKKPGDFTVAEGHGHPLVSYNGSKKVVPYGVLCLKNLEVLLCYILRNESLRTIHSI